ncbi:unnamed protein product [Oikopleura dioica]|uniref:J domain-containing protein n=1 Tax=Oikopleura dioica TaxID=34765 RepID=E4X9J2_OIKDI|nr:unnamed protein product [Oikopleura dioica]CBY40038.1 unnamed protein product [Oikopleura dioica]
MRFTLINRVRFSPRLLSEGTQRVWTSAEMHTILGSSHKTSPEELRELYLARVREIHPDTATETPTIALNELRDIYDKLLEAKIEADEKSPTLTIEDYRAEKHLQKPTMQKFLYSNAFRFIIFIPLFVILTENAWEVATDREGRNQRAVAERENFLYARALQEYKTELAVKEAV